MYRRELRMKLLLSGGEDMVALIGVLSNTALTLLEMFASGEVTLESNDGDYVTLVTEDAAVAQRFGFEEE